MVLTHGEKEMLNAILVLSCEAQEQFATRIAANIGYKLIPDFHGPTLLERVERLEKAVCELNPGLDI